MTLNIALRKHDIHKTYIDIMPDMQKFLGLEPEDRVFGAFMCGKVAAGKTFKSARSQWKTKESFHCADFHSNKCSDRSMEV